MSTERRFFGTDGIRGKVGEAPITPDFVLRLGNAMGRVLRRKSADSLQHPRVLIGKDTRISGYMLESALEAGLVSAGIDVALCGPLPTPGIAYLTRALRQDLGIVISASHNLFDDNGLKFFSPEGDKLDDSWEADIERELSQSQQWVHSRDLGRVRRVDDAQGRYIEFCKSCFESRFTLRGLKIVVDAAHGAAYQVAVSVFHELGAEVIAIASSPNGLNINDHCGATAPKLLQEAVTREKADYGVALDGDGDRLALAERCGDRVRLLDGDELLYCIALDRVDQGHPPKGIVGTVMTNMGIERALQQQGIAFARSAVGDRYVLEMLRARGWMLGGEASGHILALDKHSTGDGLIAALLTLQVVLRRKVPLATHLQALTMLPQIQINIPWTRGKAWEENAALKQAHQEAVAELQAHGRVLIRASGTEPKLRLMVEAEDQAVAQKWALALEKAARLP